MNERFDGLYARLAAAAPTGADSEALEDEIFEALDEMEATLAGPSEDRAAELLRAIAPVCHHRPDLADELLRYPCRHFDAMGFARAEWVLAWSGAAPLAADSAGAVWLLTELPRAGALIQRHLDELREGRESWASEAAPAGFMLARQLAHEGRRREAVEIYEELASAAGEPLVYRFEAARLAALDGERERAERLLGDPDLLPVLRARLLALVGDRDGAIAELEAILADAPHYALDDEEDFASLRSDARFGALLRRAGGG